MIWLFKMLKDYADTGHFNGSKIIDELSYNTKNDKAFSSNGYALIPLWLVQNSPIQESPREKSKISSWVVDKIC